MIFNLVRQAVKHIKLVQTIVKKISFGTKTPKYSRQYEKGKTSSWYKKLKKKPKKKKNRKTKQKEFTIM